MLRYTPDQMAWILHRYGKDASGHEHVPAGSPEGGQFTGQAEHGQSPDAMAKSLGKETSVDPAEVIAGIAKNIGPDMSYGQIATSMASLAKLPPEQIIAAAARNGMTITDRSSRKKMLQELERRLRDRQGAYERNLFRPDAMPPQSAPAPATAPATAPQPAAAPFADVLASVKQRMPDLSDEHFQAVIAELTRRGLLGPSQTSEAR